MKSLTNHLWVFSDGGDLENTTKRGAPGPTEPRVQEGLWGGGSGCVVAFPPTSNLQTECFHTCFHTFCSSLKKERSLWGWGEEIHFFVGEQRSY